MAGLIGLTASDIELQDALGLARFEYEDWVPHPVVRLTTNVPVATLVDGERVGRAARWGFPVGRGRPIGNARDDRLLESRMWSTMLRHGRGLVAATGIYEMVRRGETKTSYWFRPVEEKLIVMPALVGVRKIKDEERLCAAIVTTQPNAFFADYHDRQVCTLSPEEQEEWLTVDADSALELLHAPAVEEWEAVPVEDTIFQKGRIEMEHLVEKGPPERYT